jgi:hypothetical protein
MTMLVTELLGRILSQPSPDDLWRLHPHLLALDSPDAEPAREMAQLFYCYLSCVRSKLTSKQYSTLAATLAAGSVGTIAFQEVVQAVTTDRAHAVRDLLTAGLAETFEIFSTFQHVKAWETEFASVHEEVAWHLYAALWWLSVETQPDLSIGQRQALLEKLFTAIRDPNVNSGVRMALIIRLFQLLLVIRLAPLLYSEPSNAK